MSFPEIVGQGVSNLNLEVDDHLQNTHCSMECAYNDVTACF